jgi:peptidyl-prolyl isomerase E (cyclophilin E)
MDSIYIGHGHRGFGFVEFVEAADAQAALDNMHLSELYGRTIKVTMAKPMRHRDFRDRPSK